MQLRFALRAFLLTTTYAIVIHAEVVEDSCHWGDERLGLNVTYLDDTCTPVNKVQPDRSCKLNFPSGLPACGTFCHTRTKFFYGTQQPYLTQFFGLGSPAGGYQQFLPDRVQMYMVDGGLTTSTDLCGALGSWVWFNAILASINC